jgi:hypothetical protein
MDWLEQDGLSLGAVQFAVPYSNILNGDGFLCWGSCQPRSSIHVIEDDQRFPKAVLDVLPSLAAMSDGDDSVVNLILQVVDAGEVMGGRRIIRVKDGDGESEQSCLAAASMQAGSKILSEVAEVSGA